MRKASDGTEFEDYYLICSEVDDDHSFVHKTELGRFLEIPTGRAASYGGQFVAGSKEHAM